MKDNAHLYWPSTAVAASRSRFEPNRQLRPKTSTDVVSRELLNGGCILYRLALRKRQDWMRRA